MNYKVFLLMIILSMGFVVAGGNPYSFNLYGGEDVFPGQNYSINVNSSDNWNTISLGPLDDANSFQFNNVGGTLTIDEAYLNSSWCNLAGCTMSGDIDMGGNDIDFFGGNINNISHIQFNLLGDGCVDEGCMDWNEEDGTAQITLPGGNVVGQIFEENLRRVKANETITDGDVVYPCGGIASRKIVCKADYGSIYTSGIIGVATEDITKDQFGYINAFGLVRNIDTTGMFGACDEGLPAWLGSNGQITCVPPSGNKMRTIVGVIDNAHASAGILDVQMQSVPRLQGLSQVNGTGITNESIFAYNSSTGIWDNKLRYDFTGLNVTAADFIIDDMTLNGGTHNSIHDWASSTQSSGKTSGGFFTSNGDGTVNVSSGTGMIRATNSATAPILFFDWAEDLSVSLVDQSTNYIHVDYNSGSPTIHSTTDISTVNNRDGILLGKIFREGNELHIIEAGMVITELAKNTLSYFTSVFGQVVRASGGVVSETGTLNLATTEAVLYAGLTRLTTPSQDTSGADTFEYFFYNGTAWTEEDKSQINNSYYNDITSGLIELTPNRYGVHWVYIDGDSDGKIMVVYGQGDYTLTQAENSQPPSSLHAHVSDFGFLAAKIIIKKGESSFLSLSSAYDTQFTPSGATLHNELSGLQGGHANEYYHITQAESGGNWSGKNLTADYGFFDVLNLLGGNIISIVGGLIDFSVGINAPSINATTGVFQDITAKNYKNISITASSSEINFSVNGSTDLTNVTHIIMDNGSVSLSPFHPAHFRMHGEEGAALNSAFASGAVLGEQWSVANGQVGVSNEVAVCDGEFYFISIQCRTAGTGVGVVALTTNNDGATSVVSGCNVTTSGTLSPAYTECAAGSATFLKGDSLRFRTMVSDTSAICAVFAHARCY